MFGLVIFLLACLFATWLIIWLIIPSVWREVRDLARDFHWKIKE